MHETFRFSVDFRFIAIIYEVLYGRVFGLSAELTGAVAFIRQQKKNQITNGKAYALDVAYMFICCLLS